MYEIIRRWDKAFSLYVSLSVHVDVEMVSAGKMIANRSRHKASASSPDILVPCILVVNNYVTLMTTSFKKIAHSNHLSSSHAFQ